MSTSSYFPRTASMKSGSVWHQLLTEYSAEASSNTEASHVRPKSFTVLLVGDCLAGKRTLAQRLREVSAGERGLRAGTTSLGTGASSAGGRFAAAAHSGGIEYGYVELHEGPQHVDIFSIDHPSLLELLLPRFGTSRGVAPLSSIVVLFVVDVSKPSDAEETVLKWRQAVNQCAKDAMGEDKAAVTEALIAKRKADWAAAYEAMKVASVQVGRPRTPPPQAGAAPSVEQKATAAETTVAAPSVDRRKTLVENDLLLLQEGTMCLLPSVIVGTKEDLLDKLGAAAGSVTIDGRRSVGPLGQVCSETLRRVALQQCSGCAMLGNMHKHNFLAPDANVNDMAVVRGLWNVCLHLNGASPMAISDKDRRWEETAAVVSSSGHTIFLPNGADATNDLSAAVRFGKVLFQPGEGASKKRRPEIKTHEDILKEGGQRSDVTEFFFQMEH